MAIWQLDTFIALQQKKIQDASFLVHLICKLSAMLQGLSEFSNLKLIFPLQMKSYPYQHHLIGKKIESIK